MAPRRVSFSFLLLLLFLSPFISLGETCCVPAPDLLEKGLLVLEKAKEERLEEGSEKGI